MEDRSIRQTSLLETSKKIFSLAAPMSASQLINVVSGFLCMSMLAQLGHEVLSASALIFTTQISIMVTGMSVLFSLSVLIGHAYGAKEYFTIGNFVQQGWTLGLLMGIPIILLFKHVGSMLIYFGQSKEIASIVQTYFNAFAWAVIPGFLSTCNQQFGYGIRKKFLMMSTSFISVVILLMTAYMLIFGKFGFPKLGVAGLGYATAAQYSFFFIFTTLFFCFHQAFKHFELFKYRVHQHLEHFVKMFSIGWPICVQMGGELLSLFVGGIMIGWLGTTALAAYQIQSQYYFLIVIPIFSLSQASGILLGHACGAKQFHEIKKLSHASVTVVLSISIVAAFVLFFFPQNLAAFYMDINNPANAATLHLTNIIFMIVAFMQIFDSLRNLYIGMLRGLFDTRFSMVMALLTIWLIGIPLSYVLAFVFHYGVPGFFIGEMLGMVIGFFIMMYRWNVLSQKHEERRQ
ncbi:MAG: MATE family efflux transporter [Gammaproteobacteria bacterium]|nr:MATE family efflux transporter [Gammaproteobacteria bacterium]